jgi:hypothetical protein
MIQGVFVALVFGALKHFCSHVTRVPNLLCHLIPKATRDLSSSDR